MNSIKRIVLLGGGHAHVEVLRRFRMESPSNTHITLISPQRHTAYSGMMPGLVAGHYHWDECHIDLIALCGQGIRFQMTAARHIDPLRKSVLCDDGVAYPYDLLSIDVGSTSAVESIAGARQIGIPVRPVDLFLHEVERLVGRTVNDSVKTVAIVGGGAAGVELCLALRHRVGAGNPSIEFHLVSSLRRVLDGHNFVARACMRAQLRRNCVQVHLNKDVTSVEEDHLHLRDGTTLKFDAVVWATGAAAPAWLRASGLSLDARGFILTDEHLRSVSHPDVFAAGDVGSMRARAYPKSGVYAVRQGPPLAENLRRASLDQTLVRYIPQRRALALISTGARHAIASWGILAWSGKWVWRWKDSIDRKFMSRYRDA